MRSTREISNNGDIIDSRDVIARIEALQDERDTMEQTSPEALVEWDNSDEGQELKALLALADEAEGYVDDWKHGAALIRESYFAEYAEQLAEDIGDYNSRDVKWPYTCIDWEKAADELRGDYTEVDFSGVTYLVR